MSFCFHQIVTILYLENSLYSIIKLLCEKRITSGRSYSILFRIADIASYASQVSIEEIVAFLFLFIDLKEKTHEFVLLF